MVRHFILISNKQTVNKDICKTGTFVRMKCTQQNGGSVRWYGHFSFIAILLRCSNSKNEKLVTALWTVIGCHKL